MTYDVMYNLKKFPLQIRNKIVDTVKGSRSYYKLQNQMLDVNIKTSLKINEIIKEYYKCI